MRQTVLFYCFIAIFVATAVVTLLGIIGIIRIPETLLNVLGVGLLVEIAGALVALFRRTDFFARPSSDLVTALGSSFEAFDRISDEIVAAIENKPTDASSTQRYLIRRTGDSIVAYKRMQVISGAELDQLPKEQRDLIRTYERSMKAFVKEWEKAKGSGVVQLKQEERQRKLDLIGDARDDLVGILDFLQRQGIYLDDHYLTVRSLVSEIKTT